MFYANPTAAAMDAMRAGLLGAIDTPAQGNDTTGVPRWVADNGRYGNGWPGYRAWGRWLRTRRRDGCAFAVAPDVPMDAAKTMRCAGPALRFIRRLGFPAALAAQNGLEDMTVPWDEFDVLFLGGDDAWKLGPHAAALTAEARAKDKPVHMGRVNSLRRLRYAAAIGCDSADGTYLTFGPNVNLPKLLGWLRDVNDQGVLWEAS